MNSHAIDDGLNAFLRAIAIMRKNPRVLDPVSRIVANTVLVVGAVMLCSMFFGRDLDATSLALALLSVAAACIGASVVIEFVTTIAMTANVRLGRPRLPGDVRQFAKQRIVESFRADWLGTIGFFAGIALSVSSVFLSYVFASIALATAPFDNSAIGIMLLSQMIAVMLSSFASLFTVMTGRYIVVHNLPARDALANARARIAQYAAPCAAIVAVNVVMGFAQSLLAFLALADHVQVASPLVDAVAVLASTAMFAIVWIVQIVPYIALTERRDVERF